MKHKLAVSTRKQDSPVSFSLVIEGQCCGAACKLPRVTPTVVAALPPVQLPDNVPGNAACDGSSTWAPATYEGDLDRILDFWA